MMAKYRKAMSTALFSLIALALIVPAHAVEPPAQLEPVWEIENSDGYLCINAWPDCDLLYASTFMGDIQAIDTAGDIRFSVNPVMSWPDLAVAADGALWASDGLGIALISADGEQLFNINAAGVPAGEDPAAAAYVDIDSLAIYGVNLAGQRAWTIARPEEPRLAGLLPAASGDFIVETNDFNNHRQEFFALAQEGFIRWFFDATEYGTMPIAGLYPVVRNDGSLLLAQVTSQGGIGGKYGEYGSLVSLSSSGELEWVYPNYVYLLSRFPAGDGTVHVVLPDYTIHAVGRDGYDRWAYAYGTAEHLRDCLTLPDGSALVCYSWWDEMPLSNATIRIERISPAGAVTADYLLSRPLDAYWYMLPLDGLLVCLDGDTRLAAFALP